MPSRSKNNLSAITLGVRPIWDSLSYFDLLIVSALYCFYRTIQVLLQIFVVGFIAPDES